MLRKRESGSAAVELMIAALAIAFVIQGTLRIFSTIQEANRLAIEARRQVFEELERDNCSRGDLFKLTLPGPTVKQENVGYVGFKKSC